MTHCKFCNESDESRLIMSTRTVNGRAETIDICFRCLWIARFKAEGEDGNTISENNSERLRFSQSGLSDSGETTQAPARTRLQGSLDYMAGNKEAGKKQ